MKEHQSLRGADKASSRASWQGQSSVAGAAAGTRAACATYSCHRHAREEPEKGFLTSCAEPRRHRAAFGAKPTSVELFQQTHYAAATSLVPANERSALLQRGGPLCVGCGVETFSNLRRAAGSAAAAASASRLGESASAVVGATDRVSAGSDGARGRRAGLAGYKARRLLFEKGRSMSRCRHWQCGDEKHARRGGRWRANAGLAVKNTRG